MFKPASLFIGLRYFSASSENRLLSFISALAVTGLVLGVALLIVVLSVMNGFERELNTRILGLVPHIQLYRQGGIEDWPTVKEELKTVPGVVSTSPFSRIYGMISWRDKVQPIELHGEPLNSDGNQRLQKYLVNQTPEHDGNKLYIAKGIAAKLGVGAGQRVRLIVPATGEAGSRTDVSALATFTVAGIFDTGTGLDQRLAITDLKTASKLAGLGDRVLGMQIEVEDIFAVRDVRYHLQRLLPPGYYSSDWTRTHGNMYQSIKMSRELVLLLIFIIVAVAAFNVISMLVMTVTEKRSAIAILKTLGCTRNDVLRVFLVKGSLIGLAGCLIGTSVGVVVSQYIGEWVSKLEETLGLHFLSTEVYPVDYLPSQLLFSDVIMVVVVAFALNLLATLYPAWKATRVRPADELRYE